MIWLFFLLWALVIIAGMWRLRALNKATVQLIGAAILIAAAGYAWQGRPSRPGSPVEERVEAKRPESGFATLRTEFFEQFDTAARWLIISESFQRRGDTASAVGIIRAGIRSHPNNLGLWTGLGNALVAHSNGVMTPAAELAYRRAAAIAPQHPAPRFFYGLNLIEGGQVEAGEKVWRDLLATAPANAKWRTALAGRLAILDQLKAMQRQAQ